MTYKEIQRIAKKLQMDEAVIDKDWILGHFLNAMFSFSDISKSFVFKGGTCLRKNSKSKNISCCNYDDFVNQKKHRSNKRAWESSLTYHLPQGQLTDYDIAYSKVEQFVKIILK